jgi:hypothetical protein
VEVLSGGSTTSTVSVGNGGTLEFLSGGGGSFKLGSGATLVVGSGFTLSNFAVSKGVTEQILAGGTSLNATVSSGGTIVGVGLIAGQLAVRSGGTVNANNGFTLTISGIPGINAGKVEATGGGILFIDNDLVNSGTVLASGTGAGMGIQSATISNTSAGVVLVSGAGEQIDLFDGTILGGKLQTTKGGLVLAATGNNAISATTIVSGSNVEVIGGTLTATNVAVGASTELGAFNGAVLTVSGGSIGAGDAVGAPQGGTASNYVAGSFVTTADDHGGTLLTEASQNAQMLLAQPRHG